MPAEHECGVPVAWVVGRKRFPAGLEDEPLHQFFLLVLARGSLRECTASSGDEKIDGRGLVGVAPQLLDG